MTVWTINGDVTVICLDFNCTIKITQLLNSTTLFTFRCIWYHITFTTLNQS